MRLANIVKVQKPIVISDTRHLAGVIVFLRFTVYAAAFSNPTQIKCIVYATGHCILIRPASVIVTHFHHLITRSRTGITFYWYKKTAKHSNRTYCTHSNSVGQSIIYY